MCSQMLQKGFVYVLHVFQFEDLLHNSILSREWGKQILRGQEVQKE